MRFGGFLGSIASAGANFFGQRAANNVNRNIAREANVASAQSAQQQMDFQERMSNTSWQRGVTDMKKAGINPMLAFSQGGASSPGGSSFSATTGAPQQSTTSAASHSAKDAALAVAQLRNIDADTSSKLASAKITSAQLPGTAANSAFTANKLGVVNDLIDVLKSRVGYSSAVNTAKTANSSHSSSLSDFQDWVHTFRSAMPKPGSK